MSQPNQPNPVGDIQYDRIGSYIECARCNNTLVYLNQFGLCAVCMSKMNDKEYRQMTGRSQPTPIIQREEYHITRRSPGMFFILFVSVIVAAIAGLASPLVIAIAKDFLTNLK